MAALREKSIPLQIPLSNTTMHSLRCGNGQNVHGRAYFSNFCCNAIGEVAGNAHRRPVYSVGLV